MANLPVFNVETAPPDAILGVSIAFQKCKSPQKVNLGVGAYRDNEGKPYVFKVVRDAERELVSDPTMNKEYLPIDGLKELKPLTQELVFGSHSAAVKEKRVVSVQSISGTGALRVAMEFAASHMPATKVVYVSKPTWGNHLTIIRNAGLEPREYPYWNPETLGIDMPALLDCLRAAPTRSMVVLHACAHNPTGVDPSPEEWNAIRAVIKERDLVPLLDMAYQGFASGDPERDVAQVRRFEEEGFELFVAQSFAKNLGLYGERIGMLHAVTRSEALADSLLSVLKTTIRPMYSSPPIHGARIVAKVLGQPSLRSMWFEEILIVSARIRKIRTELYEALKKLGTPGDWSRLTRQIGMFSFTGLSPEACVRMEEKWSVFMLKNGRISLCGINDSNLNYVATAMDDCVRATTSQNSQIPSAL